MHTHTYTHTSKHGYAENSAYVNNLEVFVLLLDQKLFIELLDEINLF